MIGGWKWFGSLSKSNLQVNHWLYSMSINFESIVIDEVRFRATWRIHENLNKISMIGSFDRFN